MRITRSSGLLLSAAVALAVAAPAAAGSGNDPQAAKSTVPANVYYDCGNETETDTQPTDENFLAYQGDLTLWPPNHKETFHDIVAQDKDGEGTVAMETASSHDEAGMNGAGDPNNTDTVDGDVDAEASEGTASNTVMLRAERSGRGDGRTYSVQVTAEFDDDPNCMHTFTVEVPHDMRSSNAPAKKDQSDNA